LFFEKQKWCAFQQSALAAMQTREPDAVIAVTRDVTRAQDFAREFRWMVLAVLS
jgi:hypothetical protein